MLKDKGQLGGRRSRRSARPTKVREQGNDGRMTRGETEQPVEEEWETIIGVGFDLLEIDPSAEFSSDSITTALPF